MAVRVTSSECDSSPGSLDRQRAFADQAAVARLLIVRLTHTVSIKCELVDHWTYASPEAWRFRSSSGASPRWRLKALLNANWSMKPSRSAISFI